MAGEDDVGDVAPELLWLVALRRKLPAVIRPGTEDDSLARW
jgi:hypothetical protein